MSWKASAYVKNLRTAPNGEPLTRTEKLVLLVMADYYDDEQQSAWPSVSRLAGETLVSGRHLRTVLGELERKQLVKIERRQTSEHGHEANRYRLPGLMNPVHPSTEVVAVAREITAVATEPIAAVATEVTAVALLKPRQYPTEILPRPVKAVLEPPLTQVNGLPTGDAVAVPASVERLHEILTGATGYEPSTAFLAKVATKYATLDLEEEAIKIREWVERPKQRKSAVLCSTGRILNWLKKAEAERLDLIANPPTYRNGKNGHSVPTRTSRIPDGDGDLSDFDHLMDTTAHLLEEAG